MCTKKTTNTQCLTCKKTLSTKTKEKKCSTVKNDSTKSFGGCGTINEETQTDYICFCDPCRDKLED